MRDGKKAAVILGGGTSGPPISEVFCNLEDWYTVSVGPGSDSGGNSGKRRQSHGIVSPGDVGRFLIAHAKVEQDTLKKILAFRFPDDDPVFPGEVGRNIIALICEALWGRKDGTRRFVRMLDMRGEVHYASTQDTHLAAHLSDGTTLVGEGNIDTRSVDDDRSIVKAELEPPVVAEVPVLEAIRQAEVIVLAPGDFYTSLIAILLVDFLVGAINRSPARVVLVLSLMTKKAETHGYSAATFVEKLFEYGLERLDAVLVNTAHVPRSLRERYKKRDKSSPVRCTIRDRKRIRERGTTILTGKMLSKKAAKERLIRHDPERVVAEILDYLESEGIS